jgi:hypothetical protein
MTDKSPQTYTAFTQRRVGKKFSHWLEIGTGQMGDDGITVFIASLDRLPIGGFDGEVHFAPVGSEPLPPKPLRPGESDEG